MTSLLFSFQNCGQQPLQESITSSSEGKDAELQELKTIFGTNDAAKVQGLPFLFDASINQITFSSCNMKGSTSPDLFTIRAGAYDPIPGVRGNAGIKIRDELFSTLALDFKPRHPNTELIDYDFKRLLYYSPKNKNVKIQFSLREQMNLQAKMQTGESTGLNLTTYEPFDILNTDAYLTPMMNVGLMKTDYWVRYFNFADNFHRKFESFPSLPGQPSGFSVSGAEDAVANQFRNNLNQGNYILALNYVKNENADEALSPATDDIKKARSIYGRGYKLGVAAADNFYSYCRWKKRTLTSAADNYGDCNLGENTFDSRPEFLSANMNKPNYYLKEVNEVDLENGYPVGKSWKCDSLRRYVIMRDMTDAIDNALCPPDDISTLTVSQREYYLRELDIVRKHLPEHAWHVSIFKRCVAPKNAATQCYERKMGTNQNNPSTYNKLIPIQYDQSSPCVWSGSAGNPSNIETQCAHVISICVRQ